jgi:4-amino-4-deoxy-L-arabinose transferase-like glycosyltransferase
VLFVVTGWAWKRVAFGDAPPANLDTPEGLPMDPARISLHRVATLFGCLALVAAWGFARRLSGPAEAAAVLALLACSPLLIHLSQHALIDGVFGACALFALWTLWESMQPEARPAWLVGYALSFFCLVIAKESAIFPAAGCTAVMLAGNGFGFGTADHRHWFATIAAGLLGIATLTVAAGDIQTLWAVYSLLIGKVQTLGYAQATGDGPWSRYLVDLMIFTPATLCFAIGGGFRTLRVDRRFAVLLVFVVGSYLVMCNVRNGMNLRYTSIWMFPLCALAVLQARAMARRFQHAGRAFVAIVAILCAIDLAQYRQFFVKHRLYELPTADLLRAERMLK